MSFLRWARGRSALVVAAAAGLLAVAAVLSGGVWWEPESALASPLEPSVTLIGGEPGSPEQAAAQVPVVSFIEG